MGKIVAENCSLLSIFKLKKLGLLGWDSSGGGNVKWSSDWREDRDINLTYNLVDRANMYIELIYKVRDRESEEYIEINHKCPIVATPCNYGGQRPWFICSVHNSGRYCGRRVANLYLGAGSHYFACRHCYNLTYRSRIASFNYTMLDLDELGTKIKRWYYRGQPTRQHRKYIKMDRAVAKDLNNLFFKYRKRLNK